MTEKNKSQKKTEAGYQPPSDKEVIRGYQPPKEPQNVTLNPPSGGSGVQKPEQIQKQPPQKETKEDI